MSFNFIFRTVDTEKEVKSVINFIRQYPLDYHNYLDWTQKAYEQLMNGEKQAIIAISDKQIVGDTISQTIGGKVLELKNIRVHEYLQKRKFAEFMLEQLEFETSKTHKGIIVDTRKDNIAANNLFKKRNYKLINQDHLYDKINQDNIYYKDLTPNLKTLIH